MHKFSQFLRIAVLSTIGALGAASFAFGQTAVKVSLWDKGEAAMDMVGMHTPIGLAVAGADPAMATMGVGLSLQEAPDGEIGFSVTNDSSEFYHALLISPVADPAVPLPYLDVDQRVDEAAAGITANLGELKPHASSNHKVVLTPGTYILYCNISGHYAMGMWTLLTVTP